ncbi:hypothetical protein A3J20_03195 [Candidatus Gottesmanbacteria bacterium RIFCSPLOWO2_02_FULL_42_29]|uniref:Asn/Gln amidotransferase domain-containing protein n=2 Tax=Candidatus Gottesmaniibacteriota TaxID=1752720 RepID=A0A1F6B856_9BACT|nr:MAG: hypothetical protein UV09_C0003G0015 [Candidatus Gottesmanbacteria bacterium GW2011_GWA2_42_18]OGG10870.1 MAG: hypothetical protein A2781_02090 [Candidatus Gottesmanbacteria bacterium RIFCSPHIGHO2_01_FULL_42_27]OGG19201.1 MAG: hypothetical protein A3E72_00360 [Candidatus Gottesmanbacteria bacterium RIFCSPHIGHO2_12_FULL_43_26]OGG32963.1 MAG: hypothetical protein A2968_06880 [Candidatus Gottesmanbacteria bacterium RIFCSPLOWO2_01_FULL_42_22]OGG36972.1 MAG: hypothetical protein A3J20_03195 
MLLNKLREDMTAALKKGDKTTLSVLRYVLSELNYSAIDKRGELTDEEIIKLLYKEIKKRQEAILLYRQGKREELAEKESKEIDIIKQYLPAQIPDREIIIVIDEVLESLNQAGSGQAGENHPGKIIGAVLAKLKGNADGSRVAVLVKERIK